MSKILVIHGPNLNLLGQREKDIYGQTTLDEINKKLTALAKENVVELDILQSNHEGDIVDAIGKCKETGINAILMSKICKKVILLDVSSKVLKLAESNINKVVKIFHLKNSDAKAVLTTLTEIVYSIRMLAKKDGSVCTDEFTNVLHVYPEIHAGMLNQLLVEGWFLFFPIHFIAASVTDVALFADIPWLSFAHLES